MQDVDVIKDRDNVIANIVVGHFVAKEFSPSLRLEHVVQGAQLQVQQDILAFKNNVFLLTHHKVHGAKLC